MENGTQRTAPSRPTFLGHFGGPVQTDIETVNLNSNIFPREAFNDALFDERIEWGYEDMDLCCQLITKGYRITHEPSLLTDHLPPKKDTLSFEIKSERARIYTSLKRHFLWKRRYCSGVAFLVIATSHLLFRHLKHWNLAGSIRVLCDVGWSVSALAEQIHQFNGTSKLRR
jgi:GT2 family glycosyltransferase